MGSVEVLDKDRVLEIEKALTVAAPGASFARTLVERAGDSIKLDDFYETTDDEDYAKTLARALAYATPKGRPVELSRIYPVKSTTVVPSGSRIFGSGVGSGLVGPVNSPITLLSILNKSNIHISNLSFDGGVTPELGAKSYVRGINIHDSVDITFTNLFVKNVADWAVSFIRCSNVTVIRHTHRGGGLGRPGGRDGLHFLDCSDVLVDGADIESGDDCVAVTSETVGNSRITFKNIIGKSDIGSVVVSNEEGTTTFPTTDLTIENVKSKTPTRNIVRVKAINPGTKVSRVKISDVFGESAPNHGIEIAGTSSDPITELTIANCMVSGNQHGIYLVNVKSFSIDNTQATSKTAGYDGISLLRCSYGVVNGRVIAAQMWGIQLNDCISVTLSECVVLDSGVSAFSGNNGGGLRCVSTTDCVVIGGVYTGDPTKTYYGLSHNTNTRLRVTDYTVFGGAIKKSSRLSGGNTIQAPAMAGRLKEASDGTLSVQGVYGGEVTKTAVGSYTLTPSTPFGGTLPLLFVTVGHPSDSIKRRVVQRSGGQNSLTFQVIDDTTGAPVYSEYVNFLVYDQI